MVSWGMSAWSVPPGELASIVIWRAFALGVLTPIGAIITEVSLPEP